MFSNFLKEDDEEDELKREDHPSQIHKTLERKDFLIALLVFVLAISARLVFLFMNDPQSPGLGWYGDVYHHWQIAYLSKVIGFNQGFLRLWDLKGMEFFWGLLHPLTLVGLFKITGSIDILVPRLLSVFCGSAVLGIVYLLITRYFNRWAALAVSLWGAFFSVTLFSDTLGMQEQLGLLLLFGGILAWPIGALSGFLWALASMVRSEYWLFAFALVIASSFDRRKGLSGQKIACWITYAVPIVFYMKYLDTYTGNAIFPIYWNFLASVIGKWFKNVGDPLNPDQIQAQWIGRSIFAFGLIGTLFTFFKRSKGYLFLLLGFFNVTFIGFIFGFAAYVHGFFDRFWVDRLFAFPYFFIGLVAILLFFEYLPVKLHRAKKAFISLGFLFTVGLIAVSQLAWPHIFKYFHIAQAPYQFELDTAEYLAPYLSTIKGKVLMPPDRAALNYALVRNYKFDGARILGDMYDPFYYKKDDQTVEELQEATIKWLKKEKVGLIVFVGKEEYRGIFGNYPEFFKEIDKSKSGITLYEFLR